MKKVVLLVREKLEYEREIIVLLPEHMTANELDDELDEATRGGDIGLQDFVYTLKRAGITLAEPYDDSMDCPQRMEVECEEYDFVKEEESA